jgi:cellulose synthase/poly-beta-1,6-N-acetylglucosamine synthase-like glycosyltransferase
MEYLFWFSILFVIYPYAIYPLLLWLICFMVKPKTVSRKDEAIRLQPKVTLLISAYNEEDVISEKIENSLKVDYPRNLLEIVVVSDGSNDQTNRIVSTYADKGVVLRFYEGRIGKTACLNKAVPLAEGDIIVFSDANSRYDKPSIKQLTAHFADHEIGFVSGTTLYRHDEITAQIESIGIYSKLENFTKTLESQVSSCVGADGAIFAIRKSLFQPLDSLDINDLVIPFHIIKRGYRGVFDDKAYCFEQPALSLKAEFKRQVRIANRTLRAIHKYSELMNPFRFGQFSFLLVSHKLCKLLVPFALLSLFIANVSLLSRGPFYVVSLLGQVCFYLVPWLGNSSRVSRWMAVGRSFAVVHLAMLCGWMQWARGETYETWETVR